MANRLKIQAVDFIIVLFITLVSVTCLIPFIHIIALSLSSNSAIISQEVGFLPVGFTIETYYTILNDKNMIYTIFYTIFLTFLYTAVGMFLTICAAYPLTKTRLKGRKFIFVVMIITMYFSGGLIPDYMLVKNLHLLNNIWGLILPGAMSVYNMIILKSFFSSLPESLEEAASIEGCSDVGILVRIILPLSLPSVATLSLFYAVGRWNGFSDALFYITKKELFPIQLKLYQMITVNQQLDVQQAEGHMGTFIAPESLKAASIMFATVPILLVYPWLQRYFVKGVMTGAIKG